MKLTPGFVTAAIAATMTASLSADVVTDWNTATLNAIRGAATNPPMATRHLAMVQCAVFDAINGIEQVYRPYAMIDQAPAGASPEAAAAVAAHHVLSQIYPAYAEEFDALLATSLAEIPEGEAKALGMSFGAMCGQQILDLRSDDGSTDIVPYVPGKGPGWWIPTPPAFLPALLPNWPNVTPWVMESGDQFRQAGPPALTGAAYTEAHDEVRILGGTTSRVRTADQTEIAYFWVDGPGTATPPGHWHVIAKGIVEEMGLSTIDRARLFALLGMANADAAIISWDMKYAYNFWRPVTGVRMADTDGNDDTIADKTWTSLIPTPPFPAYTSGHSTFSTSAARLLGHYFGTDDIAFSTSSDGLPGIIRHFDSFTQAAEEAGMSRIYGGIHWIFDHTDARTSGHALADLIWSTKLRRIGDLSGDDQVGVDDLVLLVARWGSDDADADLNGDGVVNFLDLLDLLSRWTN